MSDKVKRGGIGSMTNEIKFFVPILGARTPAPINDAPVK